MTLPDPIAVRHEQPRRGVGPWSMDMMLRLVAFNALGLVFAIAGWYNAAGSDRPRTQLTWLEVGVAGFTIAVVGDGMFVLRGRRALGEASRRLLGPELAELLPTIDPATGEVSPPTSELLLSAPGTVRYHRPGCMLLCGHDQSALESRGRASHESGGKRACEVCRP